jgi:hypothetical protein
MRITVKSLITLPPPSGLGYCCEWFFFRHNKQTGMIAARLGVTPRAVKLHKAAFRNGECACENAEGCMRRRLAEAKRARREKD